MVGNLSVDLRILVLQKKLDHIGRNLSGLDMGEINLLEELSGPVKAANQNAVCRAPDPVLSRVSSARVPRPLKLLMTSDTCSLPAT
jgi:hypothetical protein